MNGLLQALPAATGVMGLLTGLVVLARFAGDRRAAAAADGKRQIEAAAADARRQAEAAALEARHEAALTSLKGQIDRAHDKIRVLEEHRHEINGAVIELRGDIKFIRELLGRLEKALDERIRAGGGS